MMWESKSGKIFLGTVPVKKIKENLETFHHEKQTGLTAEILYETPAMVSDGR